MKKPDRLERILGKHHGDECDWNAKCIPAQTALKLLRREHAWMRRTVTRFSKIYKTSGHYDAENCSSA